MLSLTQDPLNEVIFDGKAYHLDLAFDTVIQYLSLSADTDLSDDEKTEYAIRLFLDDQILPSDSKFFEAVFEVISKEITSDPYGNNSVNDNLFGLAPVKYFDYEQDAEAIYASFLSEYNIDLLKQRGKLHWRQFKALFNGLSENSYMQRIISIRQRNLSEIEDAKTQQQLNDAKAYYSLDTPVENNAEQTQAQQTSALSAMFKAMQGQIRKGG